MVSNHNFICILLQFRALSDQLFDTPDHHNNVRQEVVNQVFTLV